MLDSVKQEMVSIVFGDYMSCENYGSLHYTSHSNYDSFTGDVYEAMNNGVILDDDLIHEMADATDWDQACGGDILSDDFLKEFATKFCWTSVRENQNIPLYLIIEFQDQVNITYFLEKNWIKKSDLVHFSEKSHNYIDDNYLLQKGIFNKFDIMGI